MAGPRLRTGITPRRIRADSTGDVSIPGVTATTPARAFTWGMAIAGRYERRTPPLLLRSTGNPQVFAVSHPGLGGADSAGDFRGSIAGAGRGRAFGVAGTPRRAGGTGHEAHGQGLQRIRFGQFRDDRAGGAAAARGRRSRVLCRIGS